MKNRRAFVDVRKSLCGEADFETIAGGLNFPPFGVAERAAGEDGGGFSAVAGLERQVGPGEEGVEIRDALESDLWLDEGEDSGGRGEVLEFRLEARGEADGLIGGIGNDCFDKADGMSEIADRCVAGMETTGFLQLDDDLRPAGSGGGFGGVK